MKSYQLCYIFIVLGFFSTDTQSLSIEQQQAQLSVIQPALIPADVPAVTETPEEAVVAAAPLSLLDVETTNPSSADPSEEFPRTARGLGFGGLGGKFGGLGFKSFGGFGSLGFGGLHGFGGGFGKFKPLFGKHFG